MKRLGIAFLLAAGCSSGPAPVALTFSGSDAMPAVGAGFQAGTGTAVVDGTGALTLTATNSGRTLLVSLDAPVTGPVLLGERHLEIDFTIDTAGWSSNDGSITINTLDPYAVTFNHVSMIAAAGGSTGAFYLDGSANFVK